MLIRDATSADLQAIDDIYHHYVHTSTCTMQTEPGTPAERAAWFDQHGPTHPVIVAEGTGADAGEILAWGSLSRYHPREGYARTVEDSVYVRHDVRAKGIGRALLAELIARADRAGHHSVLASISADQPASVRLHESMGFTEVARFRQIGWKLGRWIDVVFLQHMLG